MYGQQYNPYSYGMASPYQQRLAQLEQPMYQPSPQPLQAPQNASSIKGRVVASVEEARASQVDFDGSVTYFACPGEQRVYAKSIGFNGLPVFLTYKLCEEESPKNDGQDFQKSVIVRLEELEHKVKELSDELTTTTTAGQ